MLDISYAGAALAGLLSFFTPCILPMVPFYLCYMAGISMSELREDGDIAPGAQKRLVISAVFFALGVSTIFVLLGMGATALGQTFAQWRQPLSYVAAAVLLVFGLHFLGVIRIGLLYREARIESKAEPTTVIGAYVMGLAFGFGWTPCVGPALAAILMVASGMGDIWQGGSLLLVYGLAMTAPFVVAALFAKPFLGWMQRNRRYLGHVEKVMGVMLIIFAILIATNAVNLIADAMIRWFPGFMSLG
ncbi:MAG: cytochrome c biogenesis protein CcdA [Paracoccaceae bacterium]|jgi:cytochrome c-type biogenesis protein|uniref:cytochrome c biogenesis CcdA family protein n=1 Tax=unclassified Seohaeicola TaxID=2641111 RepID=UPI00237C00BD|nr:MULTISPECIES: cytochrome c biogenesis protein CcdA [unclassified Seohaeicola]MDF1710153.1 cytochrome c biogenesis protein CcdA [Paracoccaceae bacterium]MDD9709137.1 cytochrome c biogenesis protein CcdA [Seohaeicola sp. 4SK31]MDD9737344.1 cytochrome c biogenesis protein CcdA [Seohaeicola sp. SP36]MDM7968688.1 cytochrome c biogenesis protein CcdA [Paracoccaceae bacterium]HSG56033.1 cytochrome c biogenesis protein CcdA [Paracoccaceae bacterium]